MADRGHRRRRASRRALIGPLLMLTGGVVSGAVLWRILMLDDRRPGLHLVGSGEQLSRHDRQALDRLLGDPGRP